MNEPTRPVQVAPSRSPLEAPERPSTDGVRLWIGGLLAGVVAAGVAIVGLLIARGIFDVRVFVASGDQRLFTPSSAWYAGAAFVAALAATALLFLLLVATAPAPFAFYSWIVGLATAIAVIVPFTTNAVLESTIATATINLAIGLALLSILPLVGRSALRTGGVATVQSYPRAA